MRRDDYPVVGPQLDPAVGENGVASDASETIATARGEFGEPPSDEFKQSTALIEADNCAPGSDDCGSANCIVDARQCFPPLSRDGCTPAVSESRIPARSAPRQRVRRALLPEHDNREEGRRSSPHSVRLAPKAAIAARRKFLFEGVEPGDQVPASILRSWERSAALGLNMAARPASTFCLNKNCSRRSSETKSLCGRRAARWRLCVGTQARWRRRSPH